MLPVGFAQRRILGVPHVVGARLGSQQNFLAGTADLVAQIGIAAELTVALVDLANGGEEKAAHHEGGAARVFDRHGIGSGLGGPPGIVRRKPPQLRGGAVRGVYQERTDGPGIRLRVQKLGQQTRGFGEYLGIFMQKEDVLALRSAHAQIEGLGQSEIARYADEPRAGEFAFELLTAVGGTVVHYHDLDGVAGFGPLQRFERAP